jgi:aryl-alcohol dehydrogenase-like predicted oxidoreductase
MQYRTLGRTGIKVSPYALGAMMFGAIGNPDHDDSIRIIHKALDAGINFIDTADVYSHGESEEIVGKALKGRRDDVVLATKCGPMGDDPNQRGNSRRWIMTEVENSLRRLQTDYIDLYQIHRPDPDTDIEETLSALSDLSTAARSARSAPRRCPPPTSSRPSGSPSGAAWSGSAPSSRPTRSSTAASRRGAARRPALRDGHLVWSPLAQGMLTGRVRKGQQTDLRRAASSAPQRRAPHRRRRAAHPARREAGLPMTHLAMAFAIAHPGVTSAIIGPAHDGAARRPARRRRRHAHRRDPRPDRRDRPARHRRRHARPWPTCPRP